jgi:hypothetical protein
VDAQNRAHDGGMSVGQLRNLVTAPATDDALVDALLAFANGAELVIVGQDARFGEPRALDSDRAVYVEALERAVERQEGPIPMLRHPDGRPRPSFMVMRLGRGSGTRKLPRPLRGLPAVATERVIVPVGRRGYSLAWFRQFRTAASALAEALMLVLDPEKPYAKALCRCRYPECRKFYLARKNPKGGPANRTYCSKQHRIDHHDSPERKFMSVAIGADKLTNPEVRILLEARDAFIASGGSPRAPSAVARNESDGSYEVIFYRDRNGQHMLARVRIGADGKPRPPVEWL